MYIMEQRIERKLRLELFPSKVFAITAKFASSPTANGQFTPCKEEKNQ